MKENKIWIFKSIKQMIICIVLFCLFLFGFIYISTFDFKKEKVTDNEKFISEHKEVDIDNIYTYISASDAYSYIRNDDTIVLFGIKNSDWVGYYANILNSVAKELEIKQIYYYDITDDRADKNGTYESIVNYLSMSLTHLDDGTLNIYGPTLLVKKDGIIIYFDDETAFVKGNTSASEYWNDYQTNLKKLRLRSVLTDYIRSTDGE